MKKIALLFSVLLLISCKTVQVNQLSQKTTQTMVELGAIGKITKNLEAQVFQITSLPTYKQKIRVAANTVAFNKTTFKAYTKAAIRQQKKITISYIDTIPTKPSYVTIQILDKVQLIKALNAPHNSSINTYLQNTHKSVIITTIACYFDAIDLSSISQAEEIYLINNKPKKYSLELVKNGNTFATINFSKTTPFAYTTASFCWKKEHGNIQLANIVEHRETCARETYKNIAKLNKKINYYKY